MIKAVQLGRRGGVPVVAASMSIARTQPDTPVDQDELDRLSRVLTQQGFVGRRVVVSAPAEHLMSGVIDMPPRESGAPYDLIASQEFARIQRQTPGEFEFAWWDVPRPVRASSAGVMTVGCAHAHADAVLDVFDGCGYDVAAMDSGLAAAVRACLPQLGPPETISAVLDIGWGTARLAVVHQETIVFDRTLTCSGLNVLHKRVCESLGVEPEQADCLLERVGLSDGVEDDPQTQGQAKTVAPLMRPMIVAYLDEIAQELDASFGYASHQYPDAAPDRLVIIGGGGAVPGVAEYLDTMISPRVLPCDDTGMPGFEHAGQSACGPTMMAVALGLASYYQG